MFIQHQKQIRFQNIVVAQDHIQGSKPQLAEGVAFEEFPKRHGEVEKYHSDGDSTGEGVT